MFCSECGAPLPTPAKFCPSCGAQMRSAPSTARAAQQLPESTEIQQSPLGSAQSSRPGWTVVLRDVGIVWVLTLLGGFVVGLGGATGVRAQLASGAATLLFGTVAFTIAGCLTPVNRFRHLSLVASVAWATSFVNLLLGFATLSTWILGIVVTFVVMAAGGGLSFLFVPSRSSMPRQSGN